MRVGAAFALWLTVATALAWGLSSWLRGRADLVGQDPEALDVTRVVLTIVAGVGAVFAGVYAYRKQRLEEGASHRADADSYVARYNAAAEQLGHDQATIRLAGVYAMTRLADDWAEQRQVCVDVLCGYLRMPPRLDASGGSGVDPADQEVRSTIQAVIRSHLLDASELSSWCSLPLDLRRAHLVDFDMSRTHHDAERRFNEATFGGRETSFDSAHFDRGSADFANADFSADVTSFVGASFSEKSSSSEFRNASFAGSRLMFAGTRFDCYAVHFTGARFASQDTSFSRAVFGSRFSIFNGCEFRSPRVAFDQVTIVHKLTFSNVTLDGAHVTFDRLLLSSPATAVEWSGVSARQGGTATRDGHAFAGIP